MINILTRVPGRWFRIPYAQNALLRLLAEHGATLPELSVAEGIRWMIHFQHNHKPQHAELDQLSCSWSGRELAIVRRMRRHGQPETTLSLVFGYTPDAVLESRQLLLQAHP